MGSALVKVHAFADVWPHTQFMAIASLREGRPPLNLSIDFAATVAQMAPETRFEMLVETHLSHPTDSHPALATRLEALGVDLASINEAAQLVAAPDPAAGLLGDVDRWERELSGQYVSRIAAQFDIRMPPKPGGHSSPIRTCPHCRTRVLPTKDRRCPSCGQEFVN